MSLWSRLWDWLKFEPKESTPGRDGATNDPLACLTGWAPNFHPVPAPTAWKGKKYDPEGGDIVVEEGPSLSPYVFIEHSINPEAGHRLREFGDWSPIAQVPLKPRRKAAKRKTPKKATSPKPKGSKQRPASPKKPQKVPKGKARSKLK